MTDDAALDAMLRAALTIVARLGVTLTYLQAADALGLAPPHRVYRLTLALERLLTADAAARRPHLAALVVGRARGGLPGPGFFEAARALGLIEPDEAPAAFHARLCEAVWAAHAPRRADSP